MLKQSSPRFFSCFCFSLLCFCLVVILWGAWVRISHSGDGCGAHWPDCQGQFLIDSSFTGKTWIEWIHRLLSAVFGLGVGLLVLLSFLPFSRGHTVRKSAIWVLLFTISEALIGAGLVLAGLTGGNVSFTRLLVMNLHVLNSLLLTGGLFICWRLSLGKRFEKPFSYSLSLGKRFEKPFSYSLFFGKQFKKLFSPFGISLWFFIVAFFLIVFSGSLSSLAVSLFPSQGLWEGLVLDWASGSHWLVRFRVWHPILALLLTGSFLFYYFGFLLPCSKKNKSLLRSHRIFILLLCVTLLSGLMNLLLLSPVWLKLTHLFLFYLLVLSFLKLYETSDS